MHPNKHHPKYEPDIQPTAEEVSPWRKATTTALVAGVALLGIHEARDIHEDAKTQEAIVKLDSDLKSAQHANDRLARIVGATSGADPQQIEGRGLQNVNTLKGHNLLINPEKRAEFKKSVIKIGIKSKQAPAETVPWTGNCTGVKVSVGEESRVLTAAHCIDTGGKEWSSFTGDPSLPTAEVVNVADFVSNEFGIFGNSEFATFKKEHKPHALAPAISKDISGKSDVALLSVTEADKVFDSLPAIDISDLNTEAPTPGQEVALFGVPAAGGDKLIEATGIYLGRDSAQSGLSSAVDYVAIKAATAAEDACNYGASGSLAMFAEGGYTGPLSTRANLGYSGNPAAIQSPDNAEFSVEETLRLEKLFGVDLSEFDTICGYSVVPRDTVVALESELVRPTPPSMFPRQISYK